MLVSPQPPNLDWKRIRLFGLERGRSDYTYHVGSTLVDSKVVEGLQI